MLCYVMLCYKIRLNFQLNSYFFLSPEIKEMFKLFDRNKDKSISVDEMGKALRAMGFNMTHKDLKTAIKKIDTNSKS